MKQIAKNQENGARDRPLKRYRMIWLLAFAFAILTGTEEPAFAQGVNCVTNASGEVDKITRAVVDHAVSSWELDNAEPWNAKNLVTDSDKARARGDLKRFLEKKLGGDAAICFQRVSAGIKHFKNGYSDEAAASLIGVDLPEAAKPIVIPKKLVDLAVVATCEALAVQATVGTEGDLVWLIGLCPLLTQVTDDIRFNIPDIAKFDFNNDLLREMIRVKRFGKDADVKGADLRKHCQAHGFADVTSIDGTAFGWRCKSATGALQGIVVDAACKEQHNKPLMTYVAWLYPKKQGQFDWKCIGTRNIVQPRGVP